MSGTFSNPTTPNIPDFIVFIQNVMQIPAPALPTNSLSITNAFNVAMAIVYQQLNAIAPNIYVLAVYNLAGDNLLNYAPDQTGQTFFADARKSYSINSFVPGVVASAADQSTSDALLSPDFMKSLTLANLQNLKTPYGRQYLAFAQSMGPIWGLT